jgi:iron complex outermembrane receptor protein
MYSGKANRTNLEKWLQTFFGVSLLSSSALCADELYGSLSEELFFSEIPIVLSATRLSQPLNETPASITVIDRKMIEASGAQRPVDLLRLVPGFHVADVTGSISTASYHGDADLYARDMQVLLDGRSIYDPGFGGVSWGDIPLDVEEISRIEVIRGPNAASYGSNSFSGVINIITHHPSQLPSATVKAVLGQANTRRTFGRVSSSQGDLNYRLSLKYDENDGYDTRHDSSNSKWISFRGDYQASNRDAFFLGLGYSASTREDGFEVDPLQPERSEQGTHHYQQLKWSRQLSDGEFSLNAYHNYQKIEDDFESAVPAGLLLNSGLLAFLGLNPLDPLPFFGGTGFSSERYDVELQRIKNLSPSLRIVWGLGARQDKIRSVFTFNSNDWIKRNQLRGFANAEWQLSEDITVNLGGMYEKFKETKGLFSPRAALNINLTDNDSMRFVATQAYRVPTLWESNADLRMFSNSSLLVPLGINNGDPMVQLFSSQAGLEPEKITSFEIGYMKRLSDYGLIFDARLFHESIKKRIDEFADDSVTYVEYANNGEYSVKGLEIDLRWDPTPASMLHLGYSLTDDSGFRWKDVDDVTATPLSERTPQHTISLTGSHRFDNGLILSSSFYYMDDMEWAGDGDLLGSYHRLDLKLSKKFRLEKADGDVALILQNIDSDYQEFYTENVWSSRILLQARLNWH